MSLSGPISPQFLIVLGALLGAFVAGFFSLLHLVSAKETKVSEFRLGWIDGLRLEISIFTASVNEIINFEAIQNTLTQKEYAELTAPSFRSASESISKIQLRLNPGDAQNGNTQEGKVWEIITTVREKFNSHKNSEAFDLCGALRQETSLLLKAEWERVKRGEVFFQMVKWIAVFILAVFVLGLIFAAFLLSPLS